MRDDEIGSGVFGVKKKLINQLRKDVNRFTLNQ
jgi:hypothetical protein